MLDKTNKVQQFGHLEFRVRPCETLNQYGYAGPSECYVSLEEYLSPEFDARPIDSFRKDQLQVEPSLTFWLVPEHTLLSHQLLRYYSDRLRPHKK